MLLKCSVLYCINIVARFLVYKGLTNFSCVLLQKKKKSCACVCVPPFLFTAIQTKTVTASCSLSRNEVVAGQATRPHHRGGATVYSTKQDCPCKVTSCPPYAQKRGPLFWPLKGGVPGSAVQDPVIIVRLSIEVQSGRATLVLVQLLGNLC